MGKCGHAVALPGTLLPSSLSFFPLGCDSAPTSALPEWVRFSHLWFAVCWGSLKINSLMLGQHFRQDSPLSQAMAELSRVGCPAQTGPNWEESRNFPAEKPLGTVTGVRPTPPAGTGALGSVWSL